MIYIDSSRFANTGHKTGVEQYSFFLIRELVKKYNNEVILITPRKINLKVKQIIIPFPRLWTLFRLSWEILQNKKIDNLFVPSHVLPLIHPKNSTITIHDVVFKYSPESYSLPSRIYLNWAAKFAVKHAKNIVVPSEATKKDLIKFYKAKAEKIHVIPLGYKKTPIKLTTGQEEGILKKYKLEKEGYFLYIGRIEIKKNTDNLIKGFEIFAKNNANTKLVLAGFPGYGGEKIIKNIPKNLRNRIILTGYISEIEKEALLKNCLSFIFPSRFEGFGIPLLEAMSAKVPIIASDIPTSREIMKENALFFKKEKATDLAEQMKKISEKPLKEGELKERYEKNLKNYNWDLHSDKIYSIITNQTLNSQP
jgi:glycosyltransferase involved in cell wall biosynthesis